jgi:hypothetical protein
MLPWTDRVNRLVMGTVLAACSVGGAPPEPVDSTCDRDPRCHALRNFFLRYQSPLHRLAIRFLQAADAHRLDWRLLPAISMVETTGGKFGTPHNVFGWNSGRSRFVTTEAGIDYVASRFGKSPIYAGKSEQGILQKYNPDRKKYPPKVAYFMRELSHDPVE